MCKKQNNARRGRSEEQLYNIHNIKLDLVTNYLLLISIFCFSLRPDHLNGHIKQVHTTERPHKCQVKHNCY